jgi:PTH1 family peptidyl-tRNA hydrolase
VYCVVGLGNPGREYESSWHNVGFRVVDEIARRSGVSIRRRSYRALTAETRIGRTEVLLLKPETYMNRSGIAVATACSDRGIAIDQIVVIHDDVDLPLGRLRVKRGGGSGGHRGIASISEELHDVEFNRVRLGVGRPPALVDLADHVLSTVTEDALPALTEMIARAADAVAVIVESGVENAMQRFNAATPAN